jgi:hypothetical protein
MPDLRRPSPALLIVAAFSRHADALTWARERLERCYGPVALSSPRFAFVQTDYYTATMGPGLMKELLAFPEPVPLQRLAAIKRQTIALEAELSGSGRFPEARPLNLDPGLLTLGKFMLATTKDQAHRLYLGRGIFAEVTLRYHAGEFQPWPWTYADYRLPEVRGFLQEARNHYRGRLAERRQPG